MSAVDEKARSLDRDNLRSEAQWEYAAGGASKELTKWAGTNDLSELVGFAWYEQNSGGKVHQAGEKKPNSVGIFDMSGNVFEWCLDNYTEQYLESPQINPCVTHSYEGNAVLRGGSFQLDAEGCTITSRRTGSRKHVSVKAGFRLARSI
jgi:formylglycine-generating enzyme required for sulfatase activity